MSITRVKNATIYHDARRRTATCVMMGHAACCVENAAETDTVLMSALCDARQRASTRGQVLTLRQEEATASSFFDPFGKHTCQTMV